MEKSRAIIEQRVNALGASEAVVQLQGSDQILVQIPGLSDTETALSTIGKTGKLEFARWIRSPMRMSRPRSRTASTVPAALSPMTSAIRCLPARPSI